MYLKMETTLLIKQVDQYQLLFEDMAGGEHTSKVIPGLSLMPKDVIVGDLKGSTWGNFVVFADRSFETAAKLGKGRYPKDTKYEDLDRFLTDLAVSLPPDDHFYLQWGQHYSRRFTVLGINQDQLFTMSIFLEKKFSDLYDHVLDNPYLCPWLSLDIADNISKIRDRCDAEARYIGVLIRILFKSYNDDGHTGLPLPLVDPAKERFFPWIKHAYPSIMSMVHVAKKSNLLMCDDSFIRLAPIFKMEVEVGEMLVDHEKQSNISILESKPTVTLNKSQAHAFKSVMKRNVTMISGEGGTGKTTVIQQLYRCIPGNKVVLAYTGRAAARLGLGPNGIRCAKTIHRFLESDIDFTEAIVFY